MVSIDHFAPATQFVRAALIVSASPERSTRLPRWRRKRVTATRCAHLLHRRQRGNFISVAANRPKMVIETDLFSTLLIVTDKRA